MKRALLSQIKNEWKENVWLVIELLVVALVIWTLLFYIVRQVQDYRIPDGFNVENVYTAEILLNDSILMQKYAPELMEEKIAESVADIQNLVDRYRDLPMVESVAIGINMLPYKFNALNVNMHLVSGNDTISCIMNRRYMTPDAAKVIGLQSTEGKTPEQLSDLLSQNKFLISSSSELEDLGYDIKEILPESEIVEMDEKSSNDISGYIQHVKRSEYENTNYGTFIIPIQENTPVIVNAQQFAVRLHSGTEAEFEKIITNDISYNIQRNVSLINIHPIGYDRKIANWHIEVRNRTYAAGIMLLLFIVFLGLLGSFWSRVYFRTHDIAIRKTFGATDSEIFQRFITEALILLSVAFILAVGIYICCLKPLSEGYLRYYTYFKGWEWDFALAGALTFALMALMILVGVGIPARRAMKIQPAIALKEE